MMCLDTKFVDTLRCLGFAHYYKIKYSILLPSLSSPMMVYWHLRSESCWLRYNGVSAIDTNEFHHRMSDTIAQAECKN